MRIFTFTIPISEWKGYFDPPEAVTMTCSVGKSKSTELALTNRIYANFIQESGWVKVSNAQPLPGTNRTSFYVYASPSKEAYEGQIAYLNLPQREMLGFNGLSGLLSVVIPTRSLSPRELPSLIGLEIFLMPQSCTNLDATLSQETLQLFRHKVTEYLSGRPLTSTQRFAFEVDKRSFTVYVNTDPQECGVIKKETQVSFHLNQMYLPPIEAKDILSKEFFDVSKKKLTVIKSLNDTEAEKFLCIVSESSGLSEHISIKGPRGVFVFNAHQDSESLVNQMRLNSLTRATLGVNLEEVEVLMPPIDSINPLSKIIVYITPMGKELDTSFEAPALTKYCLEKLSVNICNKNQLFSFKVDGSTFIAEIISCEGEEGEDLHYGTIDHRTKAFFDFSPNLESKIRGANEIPRLSIKPSYSPFTLPVQTSSENDFEFTQKFSGKMNFAEVSMLAGLVGSLRNSPVVLDIHRSPRDVISLPYSSSGPKIEIVRILPGSSSSEPIKPLYCVVKRSLTDPSNAITLPNKYMRHLQCRNGDSVTIEPLEMTLANAPTISDVEIVTSNKLPIDKNEIAKTLLNQLIFEGFPLMIYHEGKSIIVHVKNLNASTSSTKFGVVRDLNTINIRVSNPEFDQVIESLIKDFDFVSK